MGLVPLTNSISLRPDQRLLSEAVWLSGFPTECCTMLDTLLRPSDSELLHPSNETWLLWGFCGLMKEESIINYKMPHFAEGLMGPSWVGSPMLASYRIVLDIRHGGSHSSFPKYRPPHTLFPLSLLFYHLFPVHLNSISASMVHWFTNLTAYGKPF